MAHVVDKFSQAEAAELSFDLPGAGVIKKRAEMMGKAIGAAADQCEIATGFFGQLFGEIFDCPFDQVGNRS